MAPQFIPEGHGFFAGRGRDNARRALDAAEQAGLEASVVRSTTGGYIVPNAVLDILDGPTTESTEGHVENDPDADAAAAAQAEAATAEAKAAEAEQGSVTLPDGTETTEIPAAESAEVEEKTAPEQPPKSGAGSGEDAWVAWAVEAHGYDAEEGLSRNEIIAKFAV